MTTQQKYVRFSSGNTKEIRYGRIDSDKIVPLTAAPWSVGSEETDNLILLSEAKLHSPVVPGKIACIGLNYKAHVEASFSADEAPEEPLVFFKPPSSVIGPDDIIVHPSQSERVDYEAELVLVIGKEGRNISEERANDYIFGFTCGNDVTARDLQKRDKQWARAKGFDTFAPLGPWIVTDYDYRDVLVEGIHNGEIKQSGRSSLMIFPIPKLIAHVSSFMTLCPGDIIFTGTPSGIAPMKPGDKIEVRIEGIGSLVNRVE